MSDKRARKSFHAGFKPGERHSSCRTVQQFFTLAPLHFFLLFYYQPVFTMSYTLLGLVMEQLMDIKSNSHFKSAVEIKTL